MTSAMHTETDHNPNPRAGGDFVVDPRQGLIHQLGGCTTTACELDRLLTTDDARFFHSVTDAERYGYARHCCIA